MRIIGTLEYFLNVFSKMLEAGIIPDRTFETELLPLEEWQTKIQCKSRSIEIKCRYENTFYSMGLEQRLENGVKIYYILTDNQEAKIVLEEDIKMCENFLDKYCKPEDDINDTLRAFKEYIKNNS